MASELNDPKALQRFVEDLAHEHARRLKVEISPVSLQILSTPRGDLGSVGDIDPEQVRNAVVPILEDAVRSALARTGRGRVVHEDDMEPAMSRASCHYLWFC